MTVDRGQLSILIPTRNRWVFLSRLLRYYAGSRLRHPILIGDSSDSDQAEKITETINSLRGSVRVIYQRFAPTDPIYEVAVELLKRVSTPYSVLNADDDFLVCKTMELVIEFLDDHRDYSVAHGDEATMKLRSFAANQKNCSGCILSGSYTVVSSAATVVEARIYSSGLPNRRGQVTMPGSATVWPTGLPSMTA